MKKRIFALCLALTCALTSAALATSPATYESFTDRSDIAYTQAVAVLTALGVVEGREDGAFHPEDTLTRGEMAKLIALILNGGADLTETATAPFPDVADSWCAPYVAYCAERGIVAGRSETVFAPNDPVTGFEGSKMLLCALGYDAQTERLTGRGWDLSTAMLGVTSGLFNGATGVNSAPLTRQGACYLVVNALQCLQVRYEDGGVVTGDCLLTTGFGYQVVTGTVTEAGDTLTLTDVTVNGAAAESANGTYAVAAQGLSGDLAELFVKFADPADPTPDGGEVLPGSLAAVDAGGSQLIIPAA